MKAKKGCLALLMVLVLCIGMFTGCSDINSAYNDDEDDIGTLNNADSTDDTDDIIETEDVIGEVTYVGASYMSLSTYESESEITDFATLDTSTLTEVGGMEYVYPDESAEYYMVSSATLVSAAYEDITAGCIIAVTTDASGTQQIIILKDAENEEALDVAATEETEDDGEMLPVDTYVVAEVTAVNEDGSLSLLNYVSTEDALEYTIEDYAVVDFTQFSSDETTSEYVIPDDSIVYLVENGELTELTADYIIAGDMLVIYTDEFGVTNIIVYPANTETEVSE